MRRAPRIICLALLLAACGEEVDPIGKGAGDGGATDGDDTGGDTGDTDADTDTDTDTDDPPPDSDGDGTHDGADCAPNDPDIHPGAVDIPYDGIDQDCDGLDLTDFDGDGYDADHTGGTDCNDEDPSINPGAIDEENDLDDDCDGEIDEDVPIIPTDWPIRLGGSSGALTTADRVRNADDGTLWVMGTFDGLVDFEPTHERSDTIENEGGTPDLYMASVGGDRRLGMALVVSSSSGGSIEVGGMDLDPGDSLTLSASFVDAVDLDGSAREYSRESQGGTDGLIGRFNDMGDLSWASSFGGAGQDRAAGAVQRPLGGVFVAGEVGGDAGYFGAGSATTGQGTTAVLSTTASGDADGVLIRYDVSGTPEWVQTFPASTAGEWVSPVDVLAAEHQVIVVGTFSGTIDLDPSATTERPATAAGDADIFIVAVDAETGALEWSAVLPCSGTATAGHASMDASGNILVVGSFSGTIDLDPGPTDTADAAVGGTDGFAVQLDSSGAHTWSTVLGGSGDDTLTAGDLASGGGAALVGGFSDTTSVGGTTLVSVGGADCLAMTVDGTGAVGWARGLGSADDEICTSVSASPDGYVYFSGPITRAFDFSVSGVDDLRRPSGAADAWVHRLPFTP